MMNEIFELIRIYEEQYDRLTANGIEPNEYIINKLQELKETRDRMMATVNG